MDRVRFIIETNGREYREPVPVATTTWFSFRRVGVDEDVESVSCQSVFAGYTEERPFRELRRACAVDPLKCQEICRRLFESPIVVFDRESTLAWVLLGGEALVSLEIAEALFPHRLAPHEVGRVASALGYFSTASVPASALNHAPTKSLRLRVLLRDKRRCRVCGRSPDEDVHTTLDVHHGVGWGKHQSGLTVFENLFTFCSSCHQGLTRDMEASVLASIGVNAYSGQDAERAAYFEGVSRYRRMVAGALKRMTH